MSALTEMILDPTRRGGQVGRLHEQLQKRVVGQADAITPIVDAYQTFLTGLNANSRPVANFLFLGPTGTGKTHVVESLAASLFGNPKAMIKVDCSEFQHSHEIAKLVGSPPGYLGHRETSAALSQEALNQYTTTAIPLSLVLFDEIEKASDALWRLLLGILDKAVLTCGNNRKVSFEKTMIFMTSNLGAREMANMLAPPLGFSPPAKDCRSRMASAAIEAARRKFSPEFFNRLDSVVMFHPLDSQQLERVLDLELEAVNARVQNALADQQLSFRVECEPEVRSLLLREGTDQRYGARPLKRAIERLLVKPLANLVATNQIRWSTPVVTVKLDSNGTGTIFTQSIAAVERKQRFKAQASSGGDADFCAVS